MKENPHRTRINRNNYILKRSVLITGCASLDVNARWILYLNPSTQPEFRFMRIESVHQKLYKTNRKLYALQKQKETVQLALDHKPKSILHRRECKELQERIDGLERQITFCRNQLFLIPDANGFASVREAEQEYHAAKKALEQVRRAQAKWDGIITQDEKNIEQPKPRTQKLSVLKQLAEKQAETSERNINHADTKVYRKEASL